MSDWMPGPRAGVLDMCQNWIEYMNEARRTAWAVPTAEYVDLRALCMAAEVLFQKAKDITERTAVITAECQESFKSLEAKMRFFRDRYFKMPPLTVGDWIALGFHFPDTHPTPIPPPEGAPVALLSYIGNAHVISANLGPMPGTEDLDPRSEYGYAIYIGIMPPGGATLEQAASKKHYMREPPVDGEGLTHYRFTRRRKERIYFDAEDAGKTVYVCCRYENGKGEHGKLWGPVESVVIP